MLPEILTSKNLFSLYYKKMRSTTVWGLADRLIKYSRRFMLVTKIIKYATLIVAFIETSAMLIVAATILLIALPISLIAIAIAAIADRISSKHKLDELDLKLDRDEIYVFFNVGKFGEAYARKLAEGAAVYIVASPLHKRFFTARPDGDITYISKSFFMRLRRDYFDETPGKMRYIF